MQNLHNDFFPNPQNIFILLGKLRSNRKGFLKWMSIDCESDISIQRFEYFQVHKKTVNSQQK